MGQKVLVLRLKQQNTMKNYCLITENYFDKQQQAARSTSKNSGDDFDSIAILHTVFASNLLTIKVSR